MTDIHQNKIELNKYHLNKEMAQSFQVLRNISHAITYHTHKYFHVTDEKHPNKHILVLGMQNTKHRFFHLTKAAK